MKTAIEVLLIGFGCGIIIFWVRHIATGGLPQGIRTVESGGWMAFHVTAELITGIICITGGLAIALSYNWGLPVSLFASGMLAYTGINSLAWKEVRNKPSISVMFIAPTVAAILSGIYLLTAYFM